MGLKAHAPSTGFIHPQVREAGGRLIQSNSPD
jgi:hypothetical protein